MMSDVEVPARPLEHIDLDELLEMQTATEKELIERNEMSKAHSSRGRVLRMKLYEIYEEVRIQRRGAK